jgi:hypothetical protein
MKKFSVFLCMLAIFLLTTHSAIAGPFSANVTNDAYGVAQGGAVNGIPTANDDNDGIPDINDAINLIQGTSLLRNVDADPLFVEPDEVWTELNGTIALIGLTAGNSNTIGVYTDLGVGAVRTPLLGPFSGFGFAGDGTAANPFPAAITSLGTGTNFGWYLNTVSGAGATDFFSEATLNPEGFDHMMTFDLPYANGQTIYIDTGSGSTEVTLNDPFLIAWEDLPFNGITLGDDDYDDMMYIIDKVAPVPEPATMLLLGTGLIGLVGIGRKKFFKKN